MNAALLDTDMTSEVLKQRNVNVGQHSKQYLRSHGQFAISAVTRFEIVRRVQGRQCHDPAVAIHGLLRTHAYSPANRCNL
jgi:hypothetical protein